MSLKYQNKEIPGLFMWHKYFENSFGVDSCLSLVRLLTILSLVLRDIGTELNRVIYLLLILLHIRHRESIGHKTGGWALFSRRNNIGSRAGPDHIRGLKLCPHCACRADGLAPLGARPSDGLAPNGAWPPSGTVFIWIMVHILGPDKMDAISQTTFSNAFAWMKM